MPSAVNVANAERWASTLGGVALTAYAIKQLKDRSPAGAMLAAAGTALIYRGATGYCAVYEAAGIDRSCGWSETRRALAGPRGVQVEETYTVNRWNSEFGIRNRNWEIAPIARIPNSEF
jgi:uncharacterized membrane protein